MDVRERSQTIYECLCVVYTDKGMVSSPAHTIPLMSAHNVKQVLGGKVWGGECGALTALDAMDALRLSEAFTHARAHVVGLLASVQLLAPHCNAAHAQRSLSAALETASHRVSKLNQVLCVPVCVLTAPAVMHKQ
jgi:hypothetical protein